MSRGNSYAKTQATNSIAMSTTTVTTSYGIAVSTRNRFTETGFLIADMAEILGRRITTIIHLFPPERDPEPQLRKITWSTEKYQRSTKKFPMFIPLHLNLLHLA